MKKITTVLISVLLGVTCLTGCAGRNQSQESGQKKIRITTTIFPLYDWVMNILGEHAAEADVTILLNSGADLHSYQPTADDILKISTSDVFIYIGGESDEWVEDALSTAANNDMIVLNLLDILGDDAKKEETVEGMQEEEHEHEVEEAEYDEHIWLSLRNAEVLVNSISKVLQSADKDHAGDYEKNTADYIEKLKELDQNYKDAVYASNYDTLLFGDRFPFRYLAEDYGLTYYAAFAGCSAETEASFETVVFLAKKMDELKLHSIITLESSDQKLAGTIIDNTVSKDQKILVMDSMQSATSKDADNGTTYLSIMEKNLEVLRQALE
ncbi:MAG: metal ABC transporter substrate-binding protein [Erysipelotrichaceae bacterium]|nr:metal ABC transporter substrate-binding protein [Erysipelotrichaceae bacterium]